MSAQGNIFFSTTHINRISSISFFHHHFSYEFRTFWTKVRNCVTEKFMGIFTKISITFSYEIGITKFLARWKACYEGCVMTGYRVSFGFSTFSPSFYLQ